MSERLFPTAVIGSLPRPQCVREVILDRKMGAISEAEALRVLGRAIESAILLQVRAGLDEITGGEWRRVSYVKVFPERLSGFQPDVNPSAAGLVYPAVIPTSDKPPMSGRYQSLAACCSRRVTWRHGRRRGWTQAPRRYPFCPRP